MRGESSDVEQDDPDSKFGPMQRGDFVKNFVPSVRAEPSLLRAEQARLGLGQDIHERAGFSGLRREHRREQHTTGCAARHSSARSQGQQEDRACSLERAGSLLPQVVIAVGC